MLVPRLRLAIEQKTVCEKRLAQLLDELGESETDDSEICEQHHAVIMLSFPGLGIIRVAALLAEAWQAIVARGYRCQALGPTADRVTLNETAAQ